MTTRRTVLSLMGAAPVAAVAVPPATGPLPPLDRLDRLIDELAAADRFAGVVLVVHRGRPVLSRAAGAADRARGVPHRRDTIFALGSVTKMFTAVAVAQLVQRGRIGYHATIGEYLDGFPPEVSGTVTLHQLLTHTSGLGRPPVGPPPWDPAWSTVDEVWNGTLDVIRRTPPRFPPGSRHEYSNDGYTVLGAVVAAVTGRSYYDHVRENVFRRAGMTSTDFYTLPRWRDDRRVARPYDAQRVDTLERHPFIGTPDGGAFADAADLVRFMDALTGERLLDRTHTALALSPKYPVPPLPALPDRPAVLPFATYTPTASLINGVWVLGHNGGSTLGVSTTVDRYPERDWTTVVLSNHADAAQPVASLTRTLLTA